MIGLRLAPSPAPVSFPVLSRVALPTKKIFNYLPCIRRGRTMVGFIEFIAEDEECPSCGSDEDVRYFDKDEVDVVKRCFTCDECGHEWTEWMDSHDPPPS